MGRVGTGKTTVAKQLASELDWPIFSSDKIRKTLAGVPLAERTAPELRQKIYSEQMTEQTYRELLSQGLAAPEKQYGVVLDATFSSRTYREFLRQECAKAKVHLQLIELDVDRATIASRLKARDHSAGEISDARLEDLEKLTAAYEPCSSGELAPELIKISANDTVSETIRKVLLQLAEKSSRRGTAWQAALIQRDADAALAAKRGKRSKSSLKGASRQMARSMSEKQLREFAKTKRKKLPTKKRSKKKR